MNVLILAYHFPPDQAVGARRPGNLAHVLVDRGHRVHVLAGPVAGEPAVHREGRLTIERLDPAFDARRAWARLRGRSDDHAPASSGTDGEVSRWQRPTSTAFWKRQVFAALWLPDDRQGWAVAAVRRGRRVLRTEPHVLYATAPPFSTHLAGWALHRRTRAPWVAEFRDPWTDNPVKEPFVRTRWSDAIERWLERRCLSTATRLVTTTEAAARIFRAKPGVRPDDVVVVRNGVPCGELQGRPEAPGNGRFIYFGNLYHARDPRPFLRAFARLAHAGAIPDDAGVDFVGDCGHFHGQPLSDIASSLGIGARTTIHGRVPREAGLEMLRKASGLLLLAQRQPLQVPQKLYEYIATGRPILAIADDDGETALMLREIGGHHVLDEDDDVSIDAAITSILSASRTTSTASAPLPEGWITEHAFVGLACSLESWWKGISDASTP